MRRRYSSEIVCDNSDQQIKNVNLATKTDCRGRFLRTKRDTSIGRCRREAGMKRRDSGLRRQRHGTAGIRLAALLCGRQPAITTARTHSCDNRCYTDDTGNQVSWTFRSFEFILFRAVSVIAFMTIYCASLTDLRRG